MVKDFKLPARLAAERDRLARQQGDNHATPIIRSMYPSKSRGEMSREFAQLHSLGFNACFELLMREVILPQNKQLGDAIHALRRLQYGVKWSDNSEWFDEVLKNLSEVLDRTRSWIDVE